MIERMSFYDGTLNRDKAKTWVNQENTNVIYTYGLGYRNPTTHRKPITIAEAEKIIDTESLLDVTLEEPNLVHLNAYSGNDMW